jgi:hypothetical protein
MDSIKEVKDRLNHLKSDLACAKIVKVDKVINYPLINKLENEIEKLTRKLVELKNNS